MNKIATVFGAARMNEDCQEYKNAYEIGKILAQKNYLVKHGGYNYGVMQATAKAIQNYNGEQQGYQSNDLGSRPNPYCLNIYVCSTLFERLNDLITRSDIFIVHPGGVGTLTEFSLAMDYFRKQEHKIKIYLIGDYWNFLINSEVIPKTCKKMITVITDINQLELLL